VRRNSYALAALAAAALTGFEPARTTMIPTPADDLDVAGVVSEDGKKVLVTVPSSAAAGARLEKDRTLTDALAERELAGLLVRSLANIPLPEGGRAVVTAVPGGAPLLFDQLTSSPALLRDLGATLARIHGVDTQVAEAAGAESFTARAVRDHHAAQVAEAHERGELPTAVQQHWDRLLADEALWDFTPVLIHGDLSEEELFVRGHGSVTLPRISPGSPRPSIPRSSPLCSPRISRSGPMPMRISRIVPGPSASSRWSIGCCTASRPMTQRSWPMPAAC
jgi:hypothetical protein